MNRTILTLAAAALMATSAAAQDTPADEAAREQRLEAAQKRLEAAAREVAELTAEVRGPEFQRRIEMFMPASRRAMLGVNLGGAEEAGDGVRVNSVSPGGPAAEAGVKAGDVIVAIEGKKVATGRELVKVMEGVEPGQKVALDLRRDGKPVKATVEARKLDHLFFAGRAAAMPDIALGALPAMPPMHGMELGGGHWLLDAWGDAEFVTLTPGLGRYFGADKGVLVARAPEDSTLGLQDGDVIVAIGGREPQNSRHAMRILRSYQPGESVEIRVLRDRRAQTLSAKVPERAEGDVLRHREVYRHRLAPPEPPKAPPPPKPPGEPAAT